MMNAYNEIYLEKARTSIGTMLDFAVNHLGINADKFWEMFLISKISQKIESGDSSVVAGKSGIELCLEITGKEAPGNIVLGEDKSPEYWAGWALAFYQWKTNVPFWHINKLVPIENIIHMYFPYHEMDIRQFCDRMNDLMRSAQTETNLKRIRKSLGLTQSQLAKQTDIPLRTIQQYEQRQKNINNAKTEYLIFLSKALYCLPENLLEQTNQL